MNTRLLYRDFPRRPADASRSDISSKTADRPGLAPNTSGLIPLDIHPFQNSAHRKPSSISTATAKRILQSFVMSAAAQTGKFAGLSDLAEQASRMLRIGD